MITKKICLLVLFSTLSLVSCNNSPRIKRDIKYPDLISPIYYIDTFKIKTPRVAIVDSIPYIFSLDKLIPFEYKEEFLKQKGVMQYLTPEMVDYKSIKYIKINKFSNIKKTFYYLARQNEFYFEEMFVPEVSIKNIPINKFLYEPHTFLLTLISKKDSLVKPTGLDYDDPGNDVIIDVLFSKDYILALVPIYSEKDLNIINQRWSRILNKDGAPVEPRLSN